MTRCDSCATEVITVDPNGDGLACGCWRHNPLERAAIAAFRTSPQRWAQVGEWARQYNRENAHRILTAAIDVDELAEHIGAEHAAAVRDHFLGANDD